MPSHRMQVFLASFILASVLQAHSAGSGQLTATWTDNSGGVAATRVERRLSGEPTYTAVGDVAPGYNYYVDPAIGDGLTYCYRVKAWDTAGESPYSDEVCAASASATAPAPSPEPSPSPSPYNIAVLKAGTGAGTVVSTPGGINCGTDCDEAYGSGTMVTLTASAASGSKFVGWSGGCAGTSSCTVIGNSAVLVTATFDIFIPPGRAKRASKK